MDNQQREEIDENTHIKHEVHVLYHKVLYHNELVEVCIHAQGEQ